MKRLKWFSAIARELQRASNGISSFVNSIKSDLIDFLKALIPLPKIPKPVEGAVEKVKPLIEFINKIKATLSRIRNILGILREWITKTLPDILAKPLYPLLSSYTKLEPIVIGSGIATSFEKYARVSSIAILIALVTTSMVMGYIGFTATKNIIVAVLAGTLIPLALVLPLSIALYLSLPSIVYSHRRDILESKFPIFAMNLSLLLVGGMSLIKAFEQLIERKSRDLSRYRIELDMIISLVRLGVPIDEALRRAANITPSPSMRDLLMSLASAAKVGSSLVDVVKMNIQSYNDRYALRVEKTVNSIGALMETYLALALMVPMLVAVAAVLFLLVGGEFQFISMMSLTTFFLVPFISIVMMILVDSMISKLRV